MDTRELAGQRAALLGAMDRQFRAMTDWAWLRDQASIDRILGKLERAGYDRADEIALAEDSLSRLSNAED